MGKGDQRNKPNIAVICPFRDEAPFGEFATDFIRGFEPLANEIYAIMGTPSQRLSPKVHVIEVKQGAKWEGPVRMLFKYLLRELRVTFHLLRISRKVDIVVFYGSDRTFVPAGLCAKLLGKKAVHLTMGSSVQTAQWRYRDTFFGLGRVILPFIFGILQRINYSIADMITVQSESVIDFWGLSKYRSKIITGVFESYINVDLFKIKKGIGDRRNTVGFIGRLSPEKGVMEFVEAMPLLLKERGDMEFLIGGDGALCKVIKDKLEAGNLLNKVKLPGRISHDDELAGYLNGLKLYVLPSYTEGLPTGVLEAMACGAVVIATPVGAVPDIIRDGETGFILEDNSPRCIARGIIKALEYPKLNEIVENARRLVEKQYVYEAMAERYRDALERLVGR
jgi:glycosyltransferase involved in cell wall biosynthesis